MTATPDRAAPGSRSPGAARTTPGAVEGAAPGLGSVAVVRGDARALPLPDASVDLIVTSPPYWALRDYRDGGTSLAGQVGAEPTPQEYVDALIECTREWMRVLKPSGSIFVNLGDKYASSGGHGASPTSARTDRGSHQAWTGRAERNTSGTPAKGLLYLPERYRIAATDRLGLIGRAVICWSKPNGLPESVTDRVRRSHEDWVHLVKQPRYYAAVDEIREPGVGCHPRGANAKRNPHRRDSAADLFREMNGHPLGKLPGSVWTIPTQPLTVPPELGVDHYAAFPIEWPRRIIAGWSPPGICTECGEGRRPVVDARALPAGSSTSGGIVKHANLHKADGRIGQAKRTEATITGYACACPEPTGPTAPTRPALIVDPFGGTGTTGLAAKALGRNAISVDMSADYCRLATWRTTDPGELARAMGVAKPAPVLDGQTDLLEAIADA